MSSTEKRRTENPYWASHVSADDAWDEGYAAGVKDTENPGRLEDGEQDLAERVAYGTRRLLDHMRHGTLRGMTDTAVWQLSADVDDLIESLS